MSPWGGQRHSTWASDTVIFAVVFLIVLIVTVTVDALNGPDPAPAYLTGLLGASAAALFAAAGSDKSKREADMQRDTSAAGETADRAEAKADKLVEFAKAEHPERGAELDSAGASDDGGDP